LRRFVFLLLFVLYFLSFSQSLAQEKELVINADNVSYDRENNLVEAAGSVEVIYQDVTIYGNYLVYNTSLNTAWAERGFILSYGDISIEGETLDYEVKEKKGKATDVSFGYRGIKLGGKRIEMSFEQFKLNDASFTTCDFEEPHYRVTAAEILFYPEYGWLVAYWGYFWLGPFPVVPMPTYIYDMTAEEKERRNIPPFPEIGSNDEDGFYINERLAWHVRRELSGNYSITYAAKKGVGGGVEADYIADDANRGNVRVHGNVTDGLWGGITHRSFFGEEIETEAAGPLAFFAAPKYRRYELETTLAYRERINYERVSYYPNLVLRYRKGELLRKEAKFDLEVMAGMIKEEDNVELARGGGILSLYGDLPETTIGKITPSLGVDGRFYSNGRRWGKITGGIDLSKDFAENITLGLGYLHYFFCRGASPFNYEMYRFSSSDRVTSSLFFVHGETGVGIATSHFADTWQAEDIDYSLFFRMHCYNLIVTYRSLRREFALGFSLLEVE